MANDLASYPRKCSLCRTYRNAPIRCGSGGRVAGVKGPSKGKISSRKKEFIEVVRVKLDSLREVESPHVT